MSSLYELTDDFQTVLDMIESEEYDPKTLANTLDCIECEFDAKVEGYAKVIKTLEGDIEVIKSENKRLLEKKKTIENRVKFLKTNLEQAMSIVGKKKVKTPLFTVAIQKNGGKKPLDIHGEVTEEYQKITIEPDKDKIRKALEAGEELDFAVLQEQGESLRIR